MEKQLINKLKQSLPPSVKLIAYNYSHAGQAYMPYYRENNKPKLSNG